MEQITKPLILELDEAEKETIEMVNSIMSKHGLPFYLYEGIFDKLHRQLIEGKKNELITATEQYREQQKKS